MGVGAGRLAFVVGGGELIAASRSRKATEGRRKDIM